MKKYLNIFDFKQKVDYKTEILSGLTVALALVPEAIAFALIPGFSPLTGLYAAFVLALITSIFGGRPGMISGATGAVAVIFVGLILQLKTTFPGIEPETILHYVFATVILAGLLQIIAGVLRLGKFIRLVPHPVMFDGPVSQFLPKGNRQTFDRCFHVYHARTYFADHADHLGISKTDEGHSVFLIGHCSRFGNRYRFWG